MALLTNDAGLEKALVVLRSTASDMLDQLRQFAEKITCLNVQLELEDLDHDILKVVQDMRGQLCSAKDRGNQCVKAAGVTASYVCESGVLNVVFRTLEEQSTEELLRFLTKLIEYLATCEDPLNDFEAVAAGLQINMHIIEKWENERQKAERNEEFYKNLGTGIRLVGALFEVFAPRMIERSSTNGSQAGRFIGGMMHIGAVAAPVGSAICEIQRSNSARQRMILHKAISEVKELCEARTHVLTNVQTMKHNLETVKRYIEGEEGVNGLKDDAQSPEYREMRGRRVLRDYHKIITNLRGLETVMSEVLEEARRVRLFERITSRGTYF
eukprot:Em0007g1332a